MNSEEDWQKALKASPDDRTLLLAYGDWLEEQDEQLCACQVRQKAGAGTLVYSLWHPNWGDKRHGEWRKLQYLKTHVQGKTRGSGQYRRRWGDKVVRADELVVVIEWRGCRSRSPGCRTRAI